MSNLTSYRADLPAHLQNVALDDFTKAFSTSGGTVKRITLRGRVFRLVDGGKEIAKNTEPFMDVIIVNGSKTVQKTWYAGEYNTEESSPPDCWSSTGERPDDDVPNPQCDNCKNCEQAAKGSAIGGRAACRFSMRLAVVLANNPQGDVYQLIIPQKSLFGQGDVDSMPFLQYARYVGSAGYNLNMLITRMSFDTDSDYPKIVFRNTEFLDKENYDVCVRQGATHVAVSASKLSFSRKEKALPKLVAPAGSAAAAISNNTPNTEPVAEVVAEPVVRKKAPDPVAKPKVDLAAAVDEWGDDK